MIMQNLDPTDRKLLRILQQLPDIAMADLARRIGVSVTAATRRIAAMEQSGVIEGYAIDIDPRALGFDVSVSLRITLDKTNRSAFDEFIAAAREVPEIDAVQVLLGRVDVRLNVLARDLAEYQTIYRDRILTLPHILDIEALMLVAEVKSEPVLPI